MDLPDGYLQALDGHLMASEHEKIDSFVQRAQNADTANDALQKSAIEINHRINAYCQIVKNYRLLCEEKDITGAGDFFVIAEKYENGELFVNRVDFIRRKSILTIGLEEDRLFVALVTGINKEKKSLRLRFVPGQKEYTFIDGEIVVMSTDPAKEIHFLEYALKNKSSLMHIMANIKKPYLFDEKVVAEIESTLNNKIEAQQFAFQGKGKEKSISWQDLYTAVTGSTKDYPDSFRITVRRYAKTVDFIKLESKKVILINPKQAIKQIKEKFNYG